MTFQFRFVDTVPEPIEMEENLLYISIPFSTAIHICPCGCKNEVVTKLSPSRWKLTFDGEIVSLSPSIGSWGLPCQSHYFIYRNRIKWAAPWSPEKIQKVWSRRRKGK